MVTASEEGPKNSARARHESVCNSVEKVDNELVILFIAD